MPRTEVTRNEDYEMRVVGVPRPSLTDVYHALLQMKWRGVLTLIVVVYLLINAAFGAIYWAAGGIGSSGSYADAFFFSVQTMGTIGYGAMFPKTTFANVIVVLESVVSLIVTAAATGLVFARFSQTRARVAFCRDVAVAPMDGVPTLMIRVGNERAGRIVDARFRLSLMRTTQTQEGHRIYRSAELVLERDRAASLSRSWMILHKLTADSPLAGCTAESLAACDAELTIEVVGIDETSLQTVYASYVWMHHHVKLGMRLADVLSETPDGHVLLDLTKFHLLERAE